MSSAPSARQGHRREANCTKAQNQRWWDGLTEGVSFSSDLSLSPCSKNSLVTNSATWNKRKDDCKAASNDYFLTVIFSITLLIICQNILKPKVRINTPKPEDIPFTMTEDKEKKQIPTI